MVKERLKYLIETLNLPRSHFPFIYKGTGVTCSSLEEIVKKYKINPNFLFGFDEEYKAEKIIPTSEVEKLLWEELNLAEEEKNRLKKVKDFNFEEFQKIAVSLVPKLAKVPKTMLFLLQKVV